MDNGSKYKSYADALKNGKKVNVVKKVNSQVLIKNKVRPYLTEIKTYCNSRSVYTNLFKDNAPVKLIFKWIEEDYQGSLFVIYEYTEFDKKYYLYISGRFGSCSGCDYWEDLNDNAIELKQALNELLDKMEVTNDKNKIELKEYAHPDLKLNFELFKSC